MQFTGRNLQTVRDALADAIANVHMRIGLHPEPLNYPEDIEELEAERTKYEALLARVDQVIQEEP
jgi:Tat protein secretion system quality control protein TatD with DNase activity